MASSVNLQDSTEVQPNLFLFCLSSPMVFFLHSCSLPEVESHAEPRFPEVDSKRQLCCLSANHFQNHKRWDAPEFAGASFLCQLSESSQGISGEILHPSVVRRKFLPGRLNKLRVSDVLKVDTDVHRCALESSFGQQDSHTDV